MSFNSLREKQRFYAEILTSLEKLAEQSLFLSDDEFNEVLRDFREARNNLKKKINDKTDGMFVRNTQLIGIANPASGDKKLLTSKEVVLKILGDHPAGLDAGEIVKEAEGRFRTAVKRKEKAIYLALHKLKVKKLIQFDGQTKQYSLAANLSDSERSNVGSIDSQAKRKLAVKRGTLVYHAANALAKIQGQKLQVSDLLPLMLQSGVEDSENLRTMLYNALGRRPDLFRKTGRGEFELVTVDYVVNDD